MSLRVGVDDLRALAGRWRASAGELAVPAPFEAGLPFQASAAAVNAGNADIAAAALALSARLHTGAAKVAAADAGYVANEGRSASLLGAARRV